jgi:hypothetical protein
MTAPTDASAILRKALLVLASVAVVGTAIDLATLRHWTKPVQLVPWFVLAGLVVAIVLAAVPAATTVRVARAIAVGAVLCAFFGVYEHIKTNYNVAPLDYRYTDRWATMSWSSRWWAAANKSVGPSPPLAPAVLLYGALCVCFSTIRHPALRKGGARPSEGGENQVKTSHGRVQLK